MVFKRSFAVFIDDEEQVKELFRPVFLIVLQRFFIINWLRKFS